MFCDVAKRPKLEKQVSDVWSAMMDHLVMAWKWQMPLAINLMSVWGAIDLLFSSSFYQTLITLDNTLNPTRNRAFFLHYLLVWLGCANSLNFYETFNHLLSRSKSLITFDKEVQWKKMCICPIRFYIRKPIYWKSRLKVPYCPTTNQRGSFHDTPFLYLSLISFLFSTIFSWDGFRLYRLSGKT